MGLSRELARGRAVTHTEHKIADMDVFVKGIPMQALPATADHDAGALLGFGMQQVREEGQGHAKAAPVGEVHPHHAVVKAH